MTHGLLPRLARSCRRLGLRSAAPSGVNGRGGSRAGIALVLVLCCLTLLCILVLAFLASISTELDSSSSFAASADVKQRSQTAVSLVIGQIQEATSQANVAWASQPGMIRTYTVAGDPATQYKLYSSGAMVEAAFNPLSGGKPRDVPADWAARPSEYTDLNQPMLVPNQDIGTIIPDAGKPTEKFIAQYPILDPAALGKVKGFAIDANSDGNPEGAPAAGYNPVTSGNPAPMPVQWMYMLRDGSLRTLDPSTKKLTGGAVEAGNPPVARIAFWTDDDSCKVNINTAAGDEWDDTANPGSYTDQPMAAQAFENLMANREPVAHEFQRYPGHPATTYLSAVFPGLTRTQIADLAPRISADGKYSAGGTVVTAAYAADATGVNQYPGLPLSDGMPLYASVDELRYVRSTTARTPETVLTPVQIDYSKFFLTANSRAPEVSLFNLPRVTMWPEPDLAAGGVRSLFDKSIAFCSTVAGLPYYFVRRDPTSPTIDYTSSTRNQDLYRYLQKYTQEPVPGFGGDFLSKYGNDRDQILTEIYDYIRCLNLVDPTGGTVYASDQTLAGLKNIALRTAHPGLGHVVPIEITATVGNPTRGFGRTMTLYSAMIQFSALQTDIDPASKANDLNGDGLLKGNPEKANLAKLYTTKLQAIVMFDMFSPAQGVMRFVPDLVIRVTGLNELAFDGINLNFPADAQVNFNAYTPNHEYALGGYTNGCNLFYDFDKTLGYPKVRTLATSAAPGLKYPFVSTVIDINKEWKSPAVFQGSSNIVMKIYSRDKTGIVSAAPIQEIPLNFETATVPTPAVQGSYVRTYNGGGVDDPTVAFTKSRKDPVYGYDLLYGRYAQPDSNTIINAGFNSGAYQGQTIFDVTRSLVAANGDYRLIAATKLVNLTAFGKGRGYNTPIDGTYSKLYFISGGETSSGGMVGVGQRSSNGGGHSATTGKLVPSVTYAQHIGGVYGVDPADQDRGPSVPSSIDGTQVVISPGNIPGDWDTGIGGWYDGPYINKADEGERGASGGGAYGGYGGTSPTISVSSLFSPNRQAPSPVIFGSLSTGVKANKPWQTLLFCPNPAGKSQHPGAASPPDHLLLDLFTMPVVEPYAISEPFSTAGKINLNYQIVPFTYITRNTGLQAVLRSTRLAAIPTSDGKMYKGWKSTGAPPDPSNPNPYRMVIDLDETLKGFQRRFDANNIFRSASQICEMFLVPKDAGATIDTIANWWDGYKLTGDNLRERPYAQIYSRLTTKSNTYTVHVRVQSLQKARGNAANTRYDEWNEGADRVTGEYRGSFGIERFLNPNLTAAQYDGTTPLTAYKFRTISTKQFTP